MTRRRNVRASAAVAVVGTVWALAHGAGLLGSLGESTFLLLGITSATATLVGVRRYQPALRWPWLVCAAAQVIFLVGGGARLTLHTLGNLTATRSLLPDFISLPGYAVFAVGLIGLARARSRDRSDDLDALLDGVVAALSALTLAWVFLIDPVLQNHHTPLPVRVMLAAYPPASVFLVAITARIAFGRGSHRTPAHRYLMVALSVMLAGDLVYMLVDANLANLPPTLIDLPYALAYVAFAAAVLHPSMRELTEPVARTEESTTSRPRLAFVAIALAIPAFVTMTRQEARTWDRLTLSIIVLTLTAAAVWRVIRALHANTRSQERLAFQATHDVLTGLPNRVLTEQHVARALAGAPEAGTSVALVFLDVDRFKLVNDTQGHSLGDELLIAVAHRLEQNVRRQDFVARIGGDEFVVVLDDVTEPGEAMYIAEQIRACFHVPFLVRDSEIFSSASLGVAFTSGHDPTVDAETLIREADTAMYQAKAAGRDGIAVFDASMRDRIAERLALENDLRQAIEGDQLHLHYQPIVGLPGEHVEGLEALLRWSHPTMGEVSPAKFIPVAEDSGLIVEIGRWVLREACRETARWRAEEPAAAGLKVSVNLSARQLSDPALPSTVQRALVDSGLPAEALCLELTESILMENPTAAADVLGALRSLGVTLAIDDFGTGYSSLAYLKRFPVDRVKIDRAFIDGLDRADSSDETLVAAILAMAEALGLTTVAEGVEQPGQQERLVSLGCPLAQGYLFSRPVPPAEVPAALRRLAGVDTLLAVNDR